RARAVVQPSPAPLRTPPRVSSQRSCLQGRAQRDETPAPMPIEHRLHSRCACGSVLSSYEFTFASRPFTLAGTKRIYERPRPFTIRHIALDLTLNIEQRSIAGSARLDAVRID